MPDERYLKILPSCMMYVCTDASDDSSCICMAAVFFFYFDSVYIQLLSIPSHHHHWTPSCTAYVLSSKIDLFSGRRVSKRHMEYTVQLPNTRHTSFTRNISINFSEFPHSASSQLHYILKTVARGQQVLISAGTLSRFTPHYRTH